MIDEKLNILCVDTDSSVRYMASTVLSTYGYIIDLANNGQEALRKIREKPFDIVLSELSLPKIDGMELLTNIKTNFPSIEVILLAQNGSIPVAVQAVKQGAFSFLTKPFNREAILLELGKVKKSIGKKRRRNYRLRTQLDLFDKKEFVFEDVKMRALNEKINSIANSNATALITGESGCGKEIIARNIHLRSKRRNGPYIQVSCAALSDTLLESELFGHEKGAFTGAIAERKGRFELAHNGTLFLDEVGDMPLTTQIKLLRVLQERKFERVGGSSRTIKVDIRIVSATNKDLKEEISKGRFRKDLFYRISVIPLAVHPLRERKIDIPKLLNYFLEKFSLEIHKKRPVLTDKTIEKLIQYPWPGNIRELENMMERLVVLSSRNIIDVKDLPEELDENQLVKNHFLNLPFKEAKNEMLTMYLVDSLERNQWNITKTAARIGLNRVSLIKNINKLGLKEKYFKKS